MQNRPYTEADVKALTLHVYARSVAMGSSSIEDARARIIKVLDWLAQRDRLRPAREDDA